MPYLLLGLPPGLILAATGVWFLLTGRELTAWFPGGVREGWRLRLVGLLYFLMGAFFAFQMVNRTFSLEAIGFSYLALATAVWTAWRKARTQPRAGQ